MWIRSRTCMYYATYNLCACEYQNLHITIHLSRTNEESRYPISIAQLDFEFWIANRLGWYLELHSQYLKSLYRSSKSLNRMSLDRFLVLPCISQSNIARSILLCRSIACRMIDFSSTDEFRSIYYKVNRLICLGQFSN
jgi:hypothetical protein